MRFSTKKILLLLMLLSVGAGAQTGKPDHSRPPQFDLDTYQVRFVRVPISGTGTKEEAEKIQAGHMANIGKMAQSGKLIAAGPMMDDGDLRGIFLFKASMEEAKLWPLKTPQSKPVVCEWRFSSDGAERYWRQVERRIPKESANPDDHSPSTILCCSNAGRSGLLNPRRSYKNCNLIIYGTYGK